MKRGIRILLSLLIVLCLSCVSCKSKEKPLTNIKLAEVTHSVFYAPQYAAINLGFFEEEGLSITLTNAGGADKAMAALLSGSVDLAFMGPESSVYVYNEGRQDKTVVIGTVTQRDGAFLVGRKENPNFTWDDVRGSKMIGGRKGGIPEMALERALRNAGIDPKKDVSIDTSIQFNLMAGAFTGGQGDYVTLFEPAATQVVMQGQGAILAAVGDMAGDIPYTAYQVTLSALKENRDVYLRFLRALYKGQQWVEKASGEELAKALAPSFADLSLEVLEASALRYRKIGAWRTEPSLDQASFERLLDIMQDAGELETRAPYEAIVDNSLCREIMKK